MNNAFKQAAQKVASDLREPTLSDFFVYLGKEAEGIPDLSLAKSAVHIKVPPWKKYKTVIKNGKKTVEGPKYSVQQKKEWHAKNNPSLSKEASSKLRKDVALATLYETLYS